MSTNYIQFLGCVDQPLQEDFGAFMRGQEEHHGNGE